MPDSLETVANRIAQLALREVPKLGRVGPGPVLSVVRDTETNEIFVGLNTGAPANLTDALQNSIRAQKERVAKGEVRVGPFGRQGPGRGARGSVRAKRRHPCATEKAEASAGRKRFSRFRAAQYLAQRRQCGQRGGPVRALRTNHPGRNGHAVGLCCRGRSGRTDRGTAARVDQAGRRRESGTRDNRGRNDRASSHGRAGAKDERGWRGLPVSHAERRLHHRRTTPWRCYFLPRSSRRSSSKTHRGWSSAHSTIISRCSTSGSWRARRTSSGRKPMNVLYDCMFAWRRCIRSSTRSGLSDHFSRSRSLRYSV